MGLGVKSYINHKKPYFFKYTILIIIYMLPVISNIRQESLLKRAWSTLLFMSYTYSYVLNCYHVLLPINVAKSLFLSSIEADWMK